MNIIFPTLEKSDNIDFAAIDFTKGIIVTKNPYGLIYRDSDYYCFNKCAHIEYDDISESNLIKFVSKLREKYPNITAEYLVNESK